MEEFLAGTCGLVGSLIMGKVKKKLPFAWGPGNNAIPATNPLFTGVAAWQATNDAGTTAWAVGGSFVAWGLHQLGKKFLKKS